MSEILTGRCLCGAVTYACGAPVLAPCLCHCESCRRASGSHAVAWATVPKDSFRVLTGTTLRTIASSAPVLRQFCERCGSPITYWNEGFPQTIDVTITTLDNPQAVPPREHIWMDDALSWDRPADGLPQYRQSR